MTAATCLCGCGRPLTDGFVTSACMGRVGEQLRQIADMVPAARDVAHGLSRRGGGSATGKPGSRLPLDLGATARLDAVQNQLVGWARHVAEERGAQFVATALEGRTPMDPIAEACSWLLGQMEWWRHRLEVDAYLADVDACARVVAGIARGPAAQRFLGPCGATEVSDSPGGTFTMETEPCDGDVYAREGAHEGACRLCGAKWSTAERGAWLDAVARSWLYHASEIADAYPSIKAGTIRQWLTRGLLVAHGESDGRPLLKLGEVLDLAAGDAARREEARAVRARRKETAA